MPIVNTIGSVDELIENLSGQKQRIIKLLESALLQFDDRVPFEYYTPCLVKSGIKPFIGNKMYIDTSSIEGVNNIIGAEKITFNERPSRANMQPIINSVWFAKMKDSYKNLVLTSDDADLLENIILSTGFQGIQTSKKLPLSLLTAFIVSEDFKKQRDINSVGTTMAGINNETLMKIEVPKLSENDIIKFEQKYRKLVDYLSIIRRKINTLYKEKKLLLDKYF